DDAQRPGSVALMKSPAGASFEIRASEQTTEFRSAAKVTDGLGIVVNAQRKVVRDPEGQFHVLEPESVFGIVQPQAKDRFLAGRRPTVKGPVVVDPSRLGKPDYAIRWIEHPVEQWCAWKTRIRTDSRQ